MLRFLRPHNDGGAVGMGIFYMDHMLGVDPGKVLDREFETIMSGTLPCLWHSGHRGAGMVARSRSRAEAVATWRNKTPNEIGCGIY